MNLSDITRPVSTEFQQFEALLSQIFEGTSSSFAEILHYINEVKGKRIRPILVFLTAKMLGEIQEETYHTALCVEMLHTASLLHDDVVDGDELRRGRPSVNIQYNNRTAILAGDYILAKAIQVIAHPKDQTIMSEMLNTASAMSEEELCQCMNNTPDDISQEQYLNLITHKTAMLFRSCCAGAALSVGADRDTVQQIADFGLKLGILFQLRDDQLDNDLPKSIEDIDEIMKQYSQQAIELLEGFSISDARQALKDLVIYCCKRES